MSWSDESIQLVADALATDLAQRRQGSSKGVARARLNAEVQAGHKANSPHQTQAVLGKALRRIADGAQATLGQVGLPPRDH